MNNILYEVFWLSAPKRRVKGYKKREKKRYETILTAADSLITDPYTGSELLVEDKFRGLRKIRADFDRIFYQICSECKDVPYVRAKRPCTDCDDMPQKAIKIIDVPPRKSAYK